MVSQAEYLPHDLGDVLNRARRVLKPDWPGADGVVRHHFSKFSRDMKALHRATRCGSKAQVDGRRRMLEVSFSARFVALLASYPRRRSPITLIRAKAMAAEVNLRHWSGEPIRQTDRPKGGGGIRSTLSFGPRTRAAAYLADAFNLVRFGPNEYEFSRRGRGRDAAIRETLKSVQNGGVRQLVQADVTNFYSSINHSCLKTLTGLPKSIIENHLIIPPDAHIIHSYGNTYAQDQSVRAGLPQGSRPSARLAGQVIKSILTGFDVPLALAHGDDLIVGLRRGDDPDTVISALARAFAGHPAGPFSLKTLKVHEPGQGHDFLGYEFVWNKRKYGGYMRARSSPKAEMKVRRRVAAKIAPYPRNAQYDAFIPELERWAKGYGAWSEKMKGAEYAWIGFSLDVLPITLKFHRCAAGLKFKSLTEVRDLFDQHCLQDVDRTYSDDGLNSRRPR